MSDSGIDIIVRTENETASAAKCSLDLSSSNSSKKSNLASYIRKKFRKTVELFTLGKPNSAQNQHTDSNETKSSISLSNYSMSSCSIDCNRENKIREECRICFCRLADSADVKNAQNRLHCIENCKCEFCTDCLNKYIKQCIDNHNVLSIHCPDAKCPANGYLTSAEIKHILFSSMNNNATSLTHQSDLIENVYKKYLKICENVAVMQDPSRCHCPTPDCHSICQISSQTENFVKCEKCEQEFCAKCFRKWPKLNHFAGETFDLNNNQLCIDIIDDKSACQCALSKVSFRNDEHKSERAKLINSKCSLSDFKNIKRCPKCSVPIERSEGCAQIMCKFCKHTFCFYCLQSLENDFMLKHYTSDGPCKGKLGHSKLSIFVHRCTVVAIFAGSVVLMIVLSPVILLTFPCLLFSEKCRKGCIKLSSKLN